jgi:hypothetical protein
VNNEFEWRNEMRKLEGPVQPARDLWPQIQAGIAMAPARRSHWPRFAAAAALLVACGSGAVAWRVLHTAAEPALDPSARTALDWAQPANTSLAAAAQDLDGASAQLQQALEQRPDAVFLVGLLNRTNNQRMRLLQAPRAG